MKNLEVQSKDPDFQDLERHDLLTGEPRYVEDEVRNVNLVKLFGGLAFVFLLVAMILNWILYYRDRSYTFGWHAVWLIGLMIFALVCLGWAFMAGPAVTSGRQPMAAFSGFVYIMSLIAIGYLLCEAIWLIIYRPFHFSYLVGLKANQDTWDRRMPTGYNFQEAWRQDRKMMWWVVFFGILAAACFGFIAYAARSVMWNRFHITKLGLYVSLAFLALAGWMVIYWVEESYEYQRVMPGTFAGNLPLLAKIIGISAVVLAGVNAIVNLVTSRILSFVVAALEIVLLVCAVAVCGLILREVRKASLNDIFQNNNCYATMVTIHEKDFEGFCSIGGKYLNSGTYCRKEDLTSRWEGSGELRSLNPACCSISKYFYLKPFAMIGYWLLVLIFSLLVAIASNFYLADTNDYLTITNKSLDASDYGGLALVLLTILAFGIYFWARKPNKLPNSSNPGFAAYQDPWMNPISDFPLVPESVKQSAISKQGMTVPIMDDTCYPYATDGAVIPTFSTDSNKASCTDPATCVERLALYLPNGKLMVGNANTQATLAGSNSREVFFPGCTGKLGNYYLFYGSSQQIQAVVQSLRVCPVSNTTNTTLVLMYHDQVANSSIGTNGLVPGESTTAFTPTDSDQLACGQDYPVGLGQKCDGRCKLRLNPVRSPSTYALKGKFYTIQNNAENYNIHNGLLLTVKRASDGSFISNDFTLYDTGLFVVKGIPKEKDGAYIATLEITDPVGVFLTKKINIKVPQELGIDEEISAGVVRLITRNGLVCGAGDQSCINNMAQLKGTVNMSVRNGTLNQSYAQGTPLSGVELAISQYHDVNGVPIKTLTTNDQGTANFTDMPYDSYTINARATGFMPDVRFLDLQEPVNTPVPIVLRPSLSGADVHIDSLIKDSNVDFDLNLNAKSASGAQCTVNPYNKYCAYSAHLNDVNFGAGEEHIAVKNMAVANYVAYVSPANPYTGSCAAGTSADINNRAYHDQQSWNWDTFKQTRPIYTLNILSKIYGKRNIVTATDPILKPLALVSKKTAVESDEDAQKCKKVIRRGINQLNGSICEPTYFKKTAYDASKSTVTQANHLLIGCFTGYGWPSIIEMNEAVKDVPSNDRCNDIIKTFKPDLSLDKLTEQVNEYRRNNPNVGS